MAQKTTRGPQLKSQFEEHGFSLDELKEWKDQLEKAVHDHPILAASVAVGAGVLIARLIQDAVDANLRGAFATTRAATRGMMKRRWGRIINIASVVGITGNKGQANYAASKAGLIGFTKSVAKELASRNILANVVAPGLIESDMTAAMPAEARQAMAAQIPLERVGTGADVAGAVAFLASDLAAYVTGQVLVVDGGMVM